MAIIFVKSANYCCCVPVVTRIHECLTMVYGHVLKLKETGVLIVFMLPIQEDLDGAPCSEKHPNIEVNGWKDQSTISM